MIHSLLRFPGVGACLAVAFFFVAQASGAADVSAQMKADVKLLQERALRDDLGMEFLESLTTETGPRLAGSEGEARARDWAVRELTRLGFSNVRIEEFEVDGWERRREMAEIISPFPQRLVVTALGGSVATPPEGITAEVVRFATFDDLLDTPEGGLDGKIVFIDDPKMVAAMDGSGYGPANRKRRTGAIEAGRRGAAAVLIRSVGTSTNRFAHTGAMASDYKTAEIKIPAAALSGPDADILASALSRADIMLRLLIDTADLGPVPSGNVIAEIPGRTRPEEIVLIGGHLDSWDLSPGALDDGAGVAITTAAAKLILDLPQKPERTIRLVLFGSEEVGLIGARAYTLVHHADKLDNHVVAAESDFGARKIWRFDTRFGEGALDAAAAIARQLYPLGINRGSNRAFGGPDLFFLRAAGVPVVSLQQDGRDYFEFHHTPNDTFDKVDADELRQNIAAYATFAYLAANMDVDFRDPGDAAVSTD